MRTNGAVFCVLSVVSVYSWTKPPIYHDKCGFQMLPSPSASFSSCVRRFMMDSNTLWTISWLLSPNLLIIGCRSGVPGVFSVKLYMHDCGTEQVDNMDLTHTHTRGTPLWKCLVYIWRYVRVWRWLKKELMLTILELWFNHQSGIIPLICHCCGSKERPSLLVEMNRCESRQALRPDVYSVLKQYFSEQRAYLSAPSQVFYIQ